MVEAIDRIGELIIVAPEGLPGFQQLGGKISQRPDFLSRLGQKTRRKFFEVDVLDCIGLNYCRTETLQTVVIAITPCIYRGRQTTGYRVLTLQEVACTG